MSRWYGASITFRRTWEQGGEGFEDMINAEIDRRNQMAEYISTMWGCRVGVNSDSLKYDLLTDPQITLQIYFEPDIMHLRKIRAYLREEGYTRAKKVSQSKIQR